MDMPPIRRNEFQLLSIHAAYSRDLHHRNHPCGYLQRTRNQIRQLSIDQQNTLVDEKRNTLMDQNSF